MQFVFRAKASLACKHAGFTPANVFRLSPTWARRALLVARDALIRLFSFKTSATNKAVALRLEPGRCAVGALNLIRQDFHLPQLVGG